MQPPGSGDTVKVSGLAVVGIPVVRTWIPPEPVTNAPGWDRGLFSAWRVQFSSTARPNPELESAALVCERQFDLEQVAVGAPHVAPVQPRDTAGGEQAKPGA